MLLNHRYRIIKDLAEGSFGKTFLAEDTQMPSTRRCVIKQLKPVNDDRPGVVELIQERFAREAAVLEGVGRGHSQIPNLLAYFQTDEQFYLVQEAVDGMPLSELTDLPWTEEKVSALVISALSAIAHIHSQNIIHRDIKPDNIILRRADSLPCLIDFGAVKELMNTSISPTGSLTPSPASSIVIGTLGFMSPEQAAGRPVFSSDLYSLAMTAIYLLTNRLPLEIPTDSTNGRLLWKQFAPEVSDRFAGILTRAIHPHPPTRYTSAPEMLAVLTTAPAKFQSPITAPVAPVKSVEPQPGPVVTPTTELTTPPDHNPDSSPSLLPEEKFPRESKKKQFLRPFSKPLLYTAAGLSALLVSTVAFIGVRGTLAGTAAEIDASTSESLQAAIASLEKKVEARPNDESARLKLVEAYQQAGEYDEATEQIDALLDENKENTNALLQKGRMEMLEGDYDAAQTFFSQAIQIDSDHVDAVNMLGRVYNDTGQYEKAIEQFQKVVELDGDSAIGYINIGSVQQLQGEFEESVKNANLAVDRAAPDELSNVYLVRANILMDAGDLDAAREDWENILTVSSQTPSDYINKSFAELSNSNNGAAIDYADQALSINPQSTGGRIAKSYVYIVNKNPQRAVELLDQALEINPGLVSAMKAKLDALVAIPDFDKSAAIDIATQALAINPNEPYILNQRCSLHFSSAQYDPAIADCTNSLKTNPHNPRPYYTRGQSYFAKKDYDNAEPDFTQFIELNDEQDKPQDATIYAARALIRVEKEDTTGAIADLTEAIALKPEEAQYYQIRGTLEFLEENTEAAAKDLRKASELFVEQGEPNAELDALIESLEQNGLI